MQLPGMREMSLRASGVPGIAWGGLVWRMLAVLVIGALLARWTWLLFAPRSAQVLPAALPASGVQAEHLFGGVAASGVTVQAALPNVRLVGVFAGTPGFAVLELDGKRQVGLLTGREIVAGTKLVEVAIDHVTIERNGARQQIRLAGKEPANSSAAALQSVPLQLVPPVAAPSPVAVPVVVAASAANAVSGVDPAMQQRMMHGRGGL